MANKLSASPAVKELAPSLLDCRWLPMAIHAIQRTTNGAIVEIGPSAATAALRLFSVGGESGTRYYQDTGRYFIVVDPDELRNDVTNVPTCEDAIELLAQATVAEGDYLIAVLIDDGTAPASLREASRFVIPKSLGEAKCPIQDVCAGETGNNASAE